MTRTLIDLLQRYREEISMKPDEDRTKREQLIVESCLALEDLLRRQEASEPAIEARRENVDSSFLRVLRGINDVNREYDQRDLDITLAEIIRTPKGRGNGAR